MRLLCHAHQTTIGVLTLSGGYTLGNDCGTGVGGKVNHLSTSVCLLEVVGDCHGIEFGLRTFACEYARGVLPRDCRTCFYLCPRQTSILTTEMPALGDEIEYSAFAFSITWIPVLHSGILDFCVFSNNDFYYRCVKLIFIAHRCGTSFKVGNVSSIVANDESALELTGIARIDAEVGGKFHGTTHAFRNVDERTIGEDCAVESCEIIVAISYDSS